jgi:hypothetical protein
MSDSSLLSPCIIYLFYIYKVYWSVYTLTRMKLDFYILNKAYETKFIPHDPWILILILMSRESLTTNLTINHTWDHIWSKLFFSLILTTQSSTWK